MSPFFVYRSLDLPGLVGLGRPLGSNSAACVCFATSDGGDSGVSRTPRRLVREHRARGHRSRRTEERIGSRKVPMLAQHYIDWRTIAINSADKGSAIGAQL
jgi:hypothetical protein